MSKRGIIFTGESVRAILAGQKTQTRRLSGTFAAGDELWVRETWRTEERAGDLVDGVRFKADDLFVPIENTVASADLWIDANDNRKYGKAWRPSLFLPRWAARITLEVLSVRVEKLQDITEADAKAEGIIEMIPYVVRLGSPPSARERFECGWDEINGKRSRWSTNPDVTVITFRRTKP